MKTKHGFYKIATKATYEVQNGHRTLADLIEGDRPRQPARCGGGDGLYRLRHQPQRGNAGEGTWLFIALPRQKRRAATEECRQLLPSVRELLFAQERLEQIAAKVRGADCGTIVIGTAYNCYYEWVTQMMAAFRTRHPGVVIKIVNGTSSELAEMLLDHRTDFCLISHRDDLPVWLPIRRMS